MKAALLLVLALTACEKTNDIAALREEATTVAKFYQPKVDELSHRIEMIFQHGKTLPPVCSASRTRARCSRRRAPRSSRCARP